MMKTVINTVIVAIIALFVFSGCAAPIKMITPAQESLGSYKILEIAGMKSDVVGKTDASILNNIMEEALEGLLDLKYFNKIIVADTIKLEQKLENNVLRPSAFNDTTEAVAVFKATLVEYDEGNAALRFFFAPFAGSGKVTLELVVTNKTSQKLLIKAQTTKSITGSFSSASDVVGPLKRAIINFIEDYFVEGKNLKAKTPAERW